MIFQGSLAVMFDTTIDGKVNYSTKYHGVELKDHIQELYKIECKLNKWECDPIDPTKYGYNMYASILTAFFENGSRINSVKLHTAWAENYLFWITKKPWEFNESIKEYTGESEEKTSCAYDNDMPMNKKWKVLEAFKIFKSLHC